MNRYVGLSGLLLLCGISAAIGLLSAGAGATAPKPPDKGVRCTVLLQNPAASKVRRIAILPPVVLLRFDGGGRIPDAQRFAVRRAVAAELPVLLKDLFEKRIDSAVVEQAALAMARCDLRPVDLFQTTKGAAEELRDKKGRVCRIELSQSALKGSASGLTVFSYKPAERKSFGRGFYGLASASNEVNPQWETARLRQVAQRLKADALLVLRVEDMDVHGSLIESFKSVWLTVHATLFSSPDGTPLVDAAFQTSAHASPTLSTDTRFGERWAQTEHALALKCMAQIAPVLVKRVLAAE